MLIKTDTAPELYGDGKERMREGGKNIPICADCFGHAGGLWVGFLDRLFLVDGVEGSLCGGDLAVELGRLDGYCTVSLH